jgi:predicted TIM-barrel fold metal-dependent hydrolase
VSAKIPGAVASLQDPALDRILDFAAEVGLVVLIHCDIDIPFAKDGDDPAYLNQIKTLFKQHPNATIIWAHMGLGRTVHQSKEHAAKIEEMLRDPALHHVYLDISWDEAAKYIVASADAVQDTADLMQRYPDRFLFGTDAAAPTDQSKYMKVFYQYGPLWKLLDSETSRKIRLRNYERIFDEARRKVRIWESTHVRGTSPN